MTTPRGLARAMSRNRHGALELLRGGAIDAWLRRSLRDPILADRVARAVAESDTRNTYRDERLVARAAMALFPEAPLHYRGQILEYDGVGTALASAMLQGRDPGVVADLLQSGLLSFWSALRGGLPPAQAALSTQYEEARRSLQDSGPGGGIERVAYDLDSYLPCLSPFVRERQVGGITELLEALEAAALAGRIEGLPLDRHVAAFAASRSAKLDPKLLPPLSATDPASRALAVAAFFAILQAAHGPAALPALARLVRRGLEPALLAIRHLRSRERLATQLEGAVSDGDLGRLHRLVTDPELRRVDGERFRQARARFVDARRGLADCARERLASGERAAAIAGSLGAGFAAIVGGCVVLGYLLAVGVLS